VKLCGVALAVLLLNVPFGYWRANVRRLSSQWFLAIHLPVPVVVALRLWSGLGWRPLSVPLLVGAFFCGQLLGGRLRRRWEGRCTVPLTSCLIWDLLRRRRAQPEVGLEG